MPADLPCEKMRRASGRKACGSFFSLEFEPVLDDDVQMTFLADMLANLPSLLSLRLSFDYLSFDNPHASINLSQVIDSNAIFGGGPGQDSIRFTTVGGTNSAECVLFKPKIAFGDRS
jgi:hypothetical protein